MPKLVNQNPKYRKHRATGQAVVTLNGQDVYLGPYSSAASRRAYDRLVGEWLANGRRGSAVPDLTVLELIAAYWRYAQAYHKPRPGGSDGELDGIRLALGHVKRIYGDTPASEFGPLALKAVRDVMIKADWSRTYINMQTRRIVRMFKYAVANQMVPPAVLQGLQAVEGLRLGKTDARESEPVRPVPEPQVYAIRDHVSRQVWGMIELQLLTGMRPGEVVAMRVGEVDTAARPLWVYRPTTHKTAYRGHGRLVLLGPKAQALLAPFLTLDPGAYLFRPADAEAERRLAGHAARKTPLSCGNVPGSNRARRPKRPPGDRYDVDAYRRAIARACDRAFPPLAPLARGEKEKNKAWMARLTPDQRAQLREWRRMHRWHPHQLRHTAATRLRKQFGLEAAQVILGHKTLSVTELYAEKNAAEAERIMADAG